MFDIRYTLWLMLIVATSCFWGVILTFCARRIRRMLINHRITESRRQGGADQPERPTYSRSGHGVGYLAALLISIFFFRLAVGLYTVSYPDPEGGLLSMNNGLEEIANSIVHTLQTFSMDESYTEYIMQGRNMMAFLVDDRPIFGHLYSFHVSVLNAVAPIAGGAILLDILTTVIPALRLAFVSTFFKKRNKYYFSELNDRSLALAQSLYDQYGSSVLLIFTDAYVDHEEEKSSERLDAARAIGAICVRSDLLRLFRNKRDRSKERLLRLEDLLIRITKEEREARQNERELARAQGREPRLPAPSRLLCLSLWLFSLCKKRLNLGRRLYLLIDDREIENLTTLTAMTDKRYREDLRGSEIWVFSKDDAYMCVEEQVSGMLNDGLFPAGEFESALGKFLTKHGLMRYRPSSRSMKSGKQLSEIMRRSIDAPIVMPINSYRNIVSHLFVDVPLYEPIVHKKADANGERDLSVTVIGTGNIGMEAILSAYWCGQMSGCRLHINVISNEFMGEDCEKAFFNRLDNISPEILAGTREGDEVLRIRGEGDAAEYAPVYASIDYFGKDIKTCSLDELFSVKKRDGLTIGDTDYFIVALGVDEDNLLISDMLRRYVGNIHLARSSEYGAVSDDPKAVIAYAVYNADLCNALNLKQGYDYSMPRGADVYMHAFGGLRELYSEKNIFLTDLEPLARRSDAFYHSLQNREQRQGAYFKRMRDHYSYWSSISRVMHIKYKCFSLGLVEQSVMDFRNGDTQGYAAMLAKAETRYTEIARDGAQSERQNDMAWLEHRRWNAYLRTKGYRATPLYEDYFYKIMESRKDGKSKVWLHGYDGNKRHKYPELRLHPCLVECDRRGMREGVLQTDAGALCVSCKTDDRLDEITRTNSVIWQRFCRQMQDPETAAALEWSLGLQEDEHLERPSESVGAPYDFKKYDYPLEDLDKIPHRTVPSSECQSQSK